MQLQALAGEKNEADQDRLKTRLSHLYQDKLLKVKHFCKMRFFVIHELKNITTVLLLDFRAN